MIGPKFATTHYFYPNRLLAAGKAHQAPHVVNIYLDFTCPFSAKIFLKLQPTVIPKLEEKHPNKFQFVFVNVVQPWHPTSVILHEFSLVVAKLLDEHKSEDVDTNKLFWDVSRVLFENKEEFWDSAVVDLDRNEIYKHISSIVFSQVKLPFSEQQVLGKLMIKKQVGKQNQDNSGNAATMDLKYFTKYLRGVGVHVTPTVSIDGIVNDSVSSGLEPDELISVFEKSL
ncbi:Piso0_001714 [Millerozyma farinosa CBS 7064]|uniref:Piso0_001714 protein n=1 Tax=Pichia sorbitophila (strain ATCC MYA-4447 / BCRC 22081 / CBS 7064 / NBRC 10061 / NRRL Y-12695) TaxID=559304 RepID=G8YNW7_PICSO|nr:Piso0_001714 [Millerozyma farinosa CBS 7064]